MRGLSRVSFVAVGWLVIGAAPALAQGVSITSVAPAQASYGESVTIVGRGFGGPEVDIRVDGTPAPVVSATGTRATFRVPVGVRIGAATITATNPGGHTASIPFEISGTVTLTLDESHRQAGVIGPEGGVLAIHRLGVTYTLTIPEGALFEPEPIVMTPIASMAGLPLDSLIAAVHFAPEGLRFRVPATLSILLPAGADVRQLAAFTGRGNGENVHLTAFGTEGSAVTLSIGHFSIGGVGAAAAATAAAMRCQDPTLECTYENALGQALSTAIHAVCAGGCVTADELAARQEDILAAWATTEIALLEEWFDKVHERLLNDALASDAGLIAAGHEFFAWRSWVAGHPCGTLDCEELPQFVAAAGTGRGALANAYAAALDRAHAECRDARVADLTVEIVGLDLLGVGPLASDQATILSAFACQLVVDLALPSTVRFGDVVPVTVSVGVRSAVAGAPVPQANVEVTVAVTEGCSVLNGSPTVSLVTDAGGTASADLTVTPCPGSDPQKVVGIAATVDDLLDGRGALLALGRTVHAHATVDTAFVIDPLHVVIDPGGSIVYTATADGEEVAVAWTSTGGTIGPGPSSTTTFTAGPATGTFAVTATSVEDPSQTVTGTVVIASTIQVRISPATATLAPGQSLQFGATVTNFLATDAVTWTASGGTISPTGAYTAGTTPGTFQVTATSVEDPSKSATATVVVAAASISGCYGGTFTDSSGIVSPIGIQNPVCISPFSFPGSVPGTLYLTFPPGIFDMVRCFVDLGTVDEPKSFADLQYVGCQQGEVPDTRYSFTGSAGGGMLTVEVRFHGDFTSFLGTFVLSRF